MIERYEEILRWAAENIKKWPENEEELGQLSKSLPFNDYGVMAIILADDYLLAAICCKDNEKLRVTKDDWSFATL